MIQFGGLTLCTSHISSTELQAQVPASAIATPGGDWTAVTVSSGASIGGPPFSIDMPPLSGNNSFSVKTVPVQASDMVWDPDSQQIYLSVPGSYGATSGEITALDPFTGQLGVSQTTGSSPNRLALASDGSYLYAGIDGNATVQRYVLPDLAPDISISLGNQYYYAIDLAADPQDSHALAVVEGNTQISPSESGVFIYDDAAPRSVSVPAYPFGPYINSILWTPDGASISATGEDAGSPNASFYQLSVDSTGVQVAKDEPIPNSSSIGPMQFDATTGDYYSTSGAVIDPSTGTIVGSYSVANIQGGMDLNPVMVPDGKLNIAYFVGTTDWGLQSSEGPLLEAYDLTHFTFLGAVALPTACNSPAEMIRWGTNGLAILTGINYPGNRIQGSGVCLVSGAFVTSPAP